MCSAEKTLGFTNLSVVVASCLSPLYHIRAFIATYPGNSKGRYAMSSRLII